MKTYKKKLDCIFGYSDHTVGFSNAIAATAIGASVIEKHFTINKKMYGPDHRMSLSPKELGLTIDLVRETSISLGSFNKCVLISEKQNRKNLKKSLVSKEFIKKGKRLKKNFFDIKRPGTGVLPKFLNKIKNYKSAVDIYPNVTIKEKMIKKLKLIK